MAAAIKYNIVYGDPKYHIQMMLKGNITNSSPSNYGFSTNPFKIK